MDDARLSAKPFTSGERRILERLVRVALPPGRVLPGAGDAVAQATEARVRRMGESVANAYCAALWALELFAVATQARPFSRLTLGRALAVLEAWGRLEPSRLALRGLLTPIKFEHFGAAETYAALECRWALEPPRPEAHRWHQQVLRGSSLDVDTLECEVVVVGTGAGGAAAAKVLAERGHAVLLLEEGERYDRADFDGRPTRLLERLYRSAGLTAAVGNTFIPIPLGCAVGGTTLINSGTCLRPRPEVLLGWGRDFGLQRLSPDALAPYFDEVESVLEVGPSTAQAIGRAGALIARGADALGWSHHPLPRNAPGCDGQGLCFFGCPTGAKRSTDVSFVPRALEAGAQLVTGVRVERVLVEAGRAVGVAGTVQAAAGAKALKVRARVVVLACGSIETPRLLLDNRLANRSRQVGRNLSIHPATSSVGLHCEPVRAWRAVPQGYAVDAFADQGLMLEGAALPLELMAMSMSGFGPAFVHLLEQFDQMLPFGVMIKDTSRGRVVLSADRRARILYWLNDDDERRLRKGLLLLARLLFASGARAVVSGLAGVGTLRSPRELDRLERVPASVRALDITAYHPLGTARMGADPQRSVVGPDHQAHDIDGLYLCDGSVVPTSLGVNPQVTIMALATRAGALISDRLVGEGASARLELG